MVTLVRGAIARTLGSKTKRAGTIRLMRAGGTQRVNIYTEDATFNFETPSLNSTLCKVPNNLPPSVIVHMHHAQIDCRSMKQRRIRPKTLNNKPKKKPKTNSML